MLEFLFAPLLAFKPALAVFLFSIVVLFVINIFYKILINQNDAKMIKQRVKDYSKEMKEAQKRKENDRAKKIMGDMMQENSKLMKLTMKPMIVSLIVVIIFLPAMSTFYGDRIADVTNGPATVNLLGVNHTVRMSEAGPVLEGAVPYEAMSSIQPGCDSNCFVAHEGGRYELRAQGNQVTVAPIVATFPFALPIIGYSVGWLGWYIICSIPLVMTMRRLMGIHV